MTLPNNDSEQGRIYYLTMREYFSQINCPCVNGRHYIVFKNARVPNKDDVFTYTCPQNHIKYEVQVPIWNVDKKEIGSDDVICILDRVLHKQT